MSEDSINNYSGWLWRFLFINHYYMNPVNALKVTIAAKIFIKSNWVYLHRIPGT